MASVEQEKGEQIRKRNPRAPSMSLRDAVGRAMTIYEREGRHTVAVDVAAQDIGYKDAQSGTAKGALASLKQFGLITRPGDGVVSVAKELETYKFSPDTKDQRTVLMRWLKSPQVYSELLSKYTDRLPSDGALRFDFIQMGFSPTGAAEQVEIFKDSVTYCDYYAAPKEEPLEEAQEEREVGRSDDEINSNTGRVTFNSASQKTHRESPSDVSASAQVPIKLTGGRWAYISFPEPFFEIDKARLKAYIDLHLADAEPSSNGGAKGEE